MKTNNFAAFILTHGRADNVTTYKILRRQGYTGPIYLIVDDEDPQEQQYREKYGDQVISFSKVEAAALFDEGDNFDDRRAVVYARNMLWKIAERLGVEYFIELDDDYSLFLYRIDENGLYGHWKINCDWLFDRLCGYLNKTPFATIALSQGGDHIGGGGGMKSIHAKRKAMNAFICKTDRQFPFPGRINEDATAYTVLQRAGLPFLTIMAAQVNQGTTQKNAGGLTDIYLAMGTYIKSFYSVMFCPSAVKIGSLKSPATRNGVKHEGHERLHHSINWNACAAKIIREAHRKPRVVDKLTLQGKGERLRGNPLD